MRVYTKVNGNLICWDADNMTYEQALKAVRDELGPAHKGTILVLVKY